jgi:hypothetical protein
MIRIAAALVKGSPGSFKFFSILDRRRILRYRYISMDHPTRYRKAVGGVAPALWHFEPECSGWPTEGYLARDNRPPTTELCPECLGIEYFRKKT